MPLYAADKMPPQPRQRWRQKPSLSTQILTGGRVLAVLCWVCMLSERKTPKNSSAACKEGQNWQGEEEGREKGRVLASCLTVLQCLLCREAGEGQVGMEDCKGALLWP